MNVNACLPAGRAPGFPPSEMTLVRPDLEYDNEENKLKDEQEELVRRIPLLHKTDVINAGI